MLNITDIKINLKDVPFFKASVTITIDDCFVIRGLAIREDKFNGHYFVTFPFRISVVNHDENKIDIAHPITEECRRFIEDKVLDEYDKVLDSECRRFIEDKVLDEYDKVLDSTFNNGVNYGSNNQFANHY